MRPGRRIRAADVGRRADAARLHEVDRRGAETVDE